MQIVFDAKPTDAKPLRTVTSDRLLFALRRMEQQVSSARVSFSAVLTGGSGRFLPDAAQSYAIITGWRVEDGDWRLYYAQWEPNL